jgi:hypothetical protein
MGSALPEPPFHRAPVTKRVLGTVLRSVVGLTHCSCTILRERILSEHLLCQLLVGGPRVAVIGMTRPL